MEGDHREVTDAIAFRFQTGTQWVHLPEKYGNWRGVCNRLRMWAVAFQEGARPAEKPWELPGRVRCAS